MQVQLTETDRRDLRSHAWNAVKRLPAPRKVRELMRDKLYLELLPRLIAAREKELNEKWLNQHPLTAPPNPQTPQGSQTPSGLWLPG